MIKVYQLSEAVVLQYDDTNALPEIILPSIVRSISFMHTIRTPDHVCFIDLVNPEAVSFCRYIKENNLSLIRIPAHSDPFYTPYLIGHELGHYLINIHKQVKNPYNNKPISTYEELFASVLACDLISKIKETYINHRDKRLFQRVLQSEKMQAAHTKEALKAYDSIAAAPLWSIRREEPDYGLIEGIAPIIHNVFVRHPSLWLLLPHIQEIHPLVSWKEFLEQADLLTEKRCHDGIEEFRALLFP